MGDGILAACARSHIDHCNVGSPDLYFARLEADCRAYLNAVELRQIVGAF
jgi:hypothetical protein